jgi:hypothetical protein
LSETLDTAAQERPDFFISRAGADALIAHVIGRILENAGHKRRNGVMGESALAAFVLDASLGQRHSSAFP